jgi:hypothetical protein
MIYTKQVNLRENRFYVHKSVVIDFTALFFGSSTHPHEQSVLHKSSYLDVAAHQKCIPLYVDQR